MSVNRIIEEGDLEKIKLLDVDLLWKTTPMFWAVRCGNLQVLDYLHSLGFDWSSEVFMYAMLAPDPDVGILKYLQKNKCPKEHTMFDIRYWYYVDPSRLWYLETYPKSYSNLDKELWANLLIATISDSFRD